MPADFIEVYDDAIDADLCSRIIERFETSKDLQPGRTGHGVDREKKHSLDLTISDRPEWKPLQTELVKRTFPFLKQYASKYSFSLMGALSPTVRDPESGSPTTLSIDNFERVGTPLLDELVPKIYRYGSINVQKYQANEGGYPHWHSETFPQDARCEALHRVLFWLYYLNDVDVGGETEFFYQQRSVTPRTGRLVFAPAGFTHTHRGNVPRSGDKYVVASWVMFQRAESLFR